MYAKVTMTIQYNSGAILTNVEEIRRFDYILMAKIKNGRWEYVSGNIRSITTDEERLDNECTLRNK